jgi:GNAT superfamily N-acetyltransferase
MLEFKGVRMGCADDADRIYDFLLNLNDENSVFSLSEQRARMAIATCLNMIQGAYGVTGLIEKNGRIEGCIGLRPSQMWYTDDWFLDELWNFVHPDYRRSDHAKKLIEFAKWSAMRLGIPLVMGIVTKKRLEPKMRLYQRQLSQIGAYFVFGKDFEDMYSQRRLNGG